MNTIVKLDQAEKTAGKLRQQGKKIVLTGGCFDILHIGHLNLLQNAKRQGDVLFVLLESDKTIKKLKGKNRPIYPQKTRARLLSELKSVDYIVLLPELKSDKDYDWVVKSIKPAIIATTQGDQYIDHKQRQAKLVSAKVVEVTPHVEGYSTTKIAKLLHEEI